MNKQIEEMSEFLWDVQSREDEIEIYNTEALAKRLVDANYRKSTDGEWVDQYKGKYANALYKCSVCGEPAFGNGKVWLVSKFCPSCGAKMSFESEGADDEMVD